MSIDKCYIIEIPNFCDDRGILVSIENELLPFEMKRAFYIFNIPKHDVRGKHAHIKSHQFIIPIRGCLDIEIKDGKKSDSFTLSSKIRGLYIPPMIWVEITSWGPESMCLVLTSDSYDEDDYIRDYEKFKEMV